MSARDLVALLRRWYKNRSDRGGWCLLEAIRIDEDTKEALDAVPALAWDAATFRHRVVGEAGRWTVLVDERREGCRWGLYAKHPEEGLQWVDGSTEWLATLDDAQLAAVAALRALGVAVREVAT